MKKVFIFFGAIMLTISASNAQNLDEVLGKYYQASGLDKLQKVNTIIMSGTIIRNDAMPIKVYKVRPYKFRQERDVADITGLIVFDGANGWSTSPWTGNSKPQVISGTVLNDLQSQADFDGPLFKWNEKGHTLELIGKEKVDEDDAFKLKLTRKDGGIEYYFIDAKTNLLIKKISYRMARDREIEIVNNFKEYREVDGIMLSFGSINLMGGQFYSEIQYDTIELNKQVDESIFVMPAN